MSIFETMDPLLKTFWFIALPASLVFIVQSIMTFMGADAHDGSDADFGGHLANGHAPFQLFSLRNLINFLLGFGWTGVTFYTTISNHAILCSLAFIVGVLFISMYFLVIKQMQKLAEDNSFKLSSTINKTAEVYLAIPESKKGKGKIMISINGSVRELEAMTENASKLETGTAVSVVKVEGNSLLIVKPL